MSSKRDRELGSEDLSQSSRNPSIPRHLSDSSIAGASPDEDIPTLLNTIQQLELQILQEQRLRKQAEQALRELGKRFHAEKKLREQEQKLRQEQEKLLRVEKKRCLQQETELHDLATRLHREQQLREQQQRELVLELFQERQLRAAALQPDDAGAKQTAGLQAQSRSPLL
ncbi:MAG: hypothetical protein Q8P67_01505 [archaeon]|nr:hypothetical protein [archaeon]